MKRMGHFNWIAALAISAVLAVPAAAQTKTLQTPGSAAKRVIVVSLADRKLALVEDGKVVRIYPVAVGKPSTPSPAGTFVIERRVMNPTYSHDGRIVPPGPNNPVGDRWMGLSIRGYGIHGTNAPRSIGKAASHGCIRMGKADIEDLFAKVQVGDTVELIATPNQETAQLFGDAPAAPAPAQPVLLAAAAHTTPAAATQPAAAARTIAATQPAAAAQTARNDANPIAVLTKLMRDFHASQAHEAAGSM